MEDLTITGGSAVGSGPENRGGGICNAGTLTLTRCTVADNRTHFRGGGIANTGTLEIVSSTISGNTAGTEGQAAQGGGIYSEGGSVTLTNSTLSDNAADSDQTGDQGGAIYTTGSLTLQSATITENFASEGGSGIYVQTAVDDLTIGNTILAGNPFPQLSDDCYFRASAGGTVQDQGYNVFLGSDGCGLVNGQNNNIQSAPQLEPLADNGGPTQTHALNASLNSPAIDAGDTDLTADQRGEPRPGGPADDIGAFEEEQLGTITVVKESFVDDPTDFPFSLDGGDLAAPIDFYLDTSLEDLDGIWYSKSFPLGAGAYTITETPVGFKGPVAIECEDDNGSLGSFTGVTADVTLAAYQHVTCTFTNAHVCDLNQDGLVSRADLTIIRGSLRSTVDAGSPGDINADGRITSQDIRGCSLQCSLSGCAEPSVP